MGRSPCDASRRLGRIRVVAKAPSPAWWRFARAALDREVISCQRALRAGARGVSPYITGGGAGLSRGARTRRGESRVFEAGMGGIIFIFGFGVVTRRAPGGAPAGWELVPEVGECDVRSRKRRGFEGGGSLGHQRFPARFFGGFFFGLPMGRIELWMFRRLAMRADQSGWP